MGKDSVWIYCRVAHSGGSSLEDQSEELKRYAAYRGYTIAGISAEYGSGLTLDRPGLSEVTQAVIDEKADIVLVKSLSRIGRGCDLVQDFIGFLSSRKVRLISLSERLQISYGNESLTL